MCKRTHVVFQKREKTVIIDAIKISRV